MFGMISEHDEEEDETFDLSGWMSRSPPSDGLGDAPMLDDTPSFTSRPRGGSVTSNVAASASAMGSEPSFTPRPRSNPRNMATLMDLLARSGGILYTLTITQGFRYCWSK